jgi:Carbohydrate esterase, sialic acid-specific acetylesterase
VVNFAAGHCYPAASPLLGADGRMGETWTLLGIKLLRSGLFRTVILIPVAVSGSAARRWAEGGDLNSAMLAAIQAAKARYTITGVLLDQGAADFALRTPEAEYRSELASLIGSLRAEGVRAPFFITRCSVGGDDWTADNPVARAQASLADDQRGIFDGPNTDRDVTPFDRYFSASGQEKYTDAWIPLLRTHPGSLRARIDPGEGPESTCAVTRRRFPVGARPTRRPLPPEATGAGMEETKCLKPPDSGHEFGERASVQAATRVNAEQTSKRAMCRPTR